jgi:hypothetical protein
MNMKKNYIAPVTNLLTLSPVSLVCYSFDGNSLNTRKDAITEQDADYAASRDYGWED